MEQIFEFVNNNGFPIVAAIGAFYTFVTLVKSTGERVDRINKEHSEEIAKLTAAHKEERQQEIEQWAKVTEAMGKVTQALGELTIYIKEGKAHE